MALKTLYRTYLLSRYFIAPFITPTFLATFYIATAIEILIYASVLSQLVKIEDYYRYLAPGILLILFYSNVYMFIDEVFFFASRTEVHLYTYILPLPRYAISLGFSLFSGLISIILFAPFILLVSILNSIDLVGIVASTLNLAMLMALFSIMIGGLLATVYMSVKSNWKLILIVLVLSDVFQRFSTGNYPYAYLPDAYKPISLLNPLTHFINLGQHMLNVDPTLLIGRDISLSIFIAYLIGLLALSTIFSERFSEGGRVV